MNHNNDGESGELSTRILVKHLDSVNHEILIAKLSFFGLVNPMLG